MITNNAINTFPPNRNMAIGTDLSINPWQRGEVFTNVSNQDLADMFSFDSAGNGRVMVTKSADAPTVAQAGIFTTHSFAATVTTVGPDLGLNQHYNINHAMEGYDWAKLAQRPVTVSFWVKSSLTGIYCISLVNAGGDRSYVDQYTITAADTWQKKIFNIPPSPSAGTWNYTNDVGIYFRWCLNAGPTHQTSAGSWATGDFLATSNQVNLMGTLTNTFKITLLQIEAGFTATPYDFVPKDKVMRDCQRYYFKSYNNSDVPGTITNSGATAAFAVTASGLLTSSLENPFVNMRTTPSITIYSPTTGTPAFVRNATAGTDEPILAFASSNDSSLGYPVFNATTSVDDNLYISQITADAAL